MNTSTILEIQSLSYYCTEGVRLMGMIENYLNGRMFHEVYPELEREHWNANDSRDLNALKVTYRKLCRLHDSVSMD